MTLAVWNCHSRKVSPPPRVRETKRSPRQILPKQYLPGVQTPAKLPLSGGTKRRRGVFAWQGRGDIFLAFLLYMRYTEPNLTHRRMYMDPIFDIELQDCPICRGVGAMQDEQGWSVSVACMDCGAETAHAEYRTPEERLESARRVALLWNMGKVVHTGASD